MGIAQSPPKHVSPMLEIAQTVEEAGGEELKSCYQCGTCTAVCPWGELKRFNPRSFIELARLGLDGFEADAWTCVNCRMCQDRCPQQIDIPQLFQSVRKILLEWNSNPDSLGQPLGSLRAEWNPWGEKKETRDAWARALEVPVYGPSTQHLLFTCCTNDFDARNRKDAKAVVEVLRQAGVSFGHLGNEQRCCGDLAYSVGDSPVFEQLQTANKATFEAQRVASVLATSPHCLNSFRQRYTMPDAARPEARHVTELYAQLLADGTLKPQKPLEAKVTYHDPCYLGRHNGVYDAPRRTLQAIPGLELVEMAHHRERSLCCGGGGGGVWMETPKGERLGDLRVQEALATGASIIATGCPWCVQMLESSILTYELEDKLRVLTVSELLADALGKGKE